MPYEIEITASTLAELKALKAYHRGQVVKAIDDQLPFNPAEETRNRKPLIGALPDFEHVRPIFQLRVGEYRVFYDIDEKQLRVTIRAVRKKPPHASTEEVL